MPDAGFLCDQENDGRGAARGRTCCTEGPDVKSTVQALHMWYPRLFQVKSYKQRGMQGSPLLEMLESPWLPGTGAQTISQGMLCLHKIPGSPSRTPSSKDLLIAASSRSCMM